MVDSADALGISTQKLPGGTLVVDCGIEAAGGLEAGRALAECCMAGLGRIDFVPGDSGVFRGPAVQVVTDHPVAACMAAQYAGWEIKGDKFFAMGSGPMRAAAGREPLFDDIDYREKSDTCVGVLESGKFPPETVCEQIAAKCGIGADRLTLLVAPTSSQAKMQLNDNTLLKSLMLHLRRIIFPLVENKFLQRISILTCELCLWACCTTR